MPALSGLGSGIEGLPYTDVDSWRSLCHEHVAWDVSTDSGYALTQLHAENWLVRNLSLLQLNDDRGYGQWNRFPFFSCKGVNSFLPNRGVSSAYKLYAKRKLFKLIC